MYIDKITINEPLGGGVVSRSFKVFNDKDFDEKSLPIKDSIEDLSSKSTKVINSWPVTGHGTHLVMDDKGLKAVTSWDEERGYRRIIYNRDPVLYIEASGPDQVKLNGEMVDLVEGSNYFEVEEITNDSLFYSSGNYGSKLIALIAKCNISGFRVPGGGAWGGSIFFGTNMRGIEIPITNQISGADIAGLFATDINDFNDRISYVNTNDWDLSNITHLPWVFCGTRMKEINVSNWNTSNIKQFATIFLNSRNLRKIDVSRWDTSSCTDFAQTFAGIGYNIPKSEPGAIIDMSNWDTSKSVRFNAIFYNSHCRPIGLNNFDLSKATSANEVFSGALFYDPYAETPTYLKELDLSNWSTPVLTSCYESFAHISYIETINIQNFDITNVTDCTRMFFNCANLTNLIFPGMGKINASGKTMDFSWTPKLSHDSLMSIFTYNRTEAGLSTLTVKLDSDVKSRLSTAEKAEISAKGYTIV